MPADVFNASAGGPFLRRTGKMTELQKTRIRTMREQGIGFAEIAKQMNISRETVKSFCKRNGVGAISDAPPTPASQQEDITVVAPVPRPEKLPVEAGVCRACGKSIEQTVGRKKRVFCCAQCRTSWWRDNQDKIQRKAAALYSFTCAGCGREFTAYGNQRRKYCSHDCYIQARFGTEGKDGNDG